jgi:hypothetical protein
VSHFFSQLSSAFRSSCNCILSLVLQISLYNKLTSAKRRTSDSVWLGMSLMYVKNNKGPSTVPCSTPDNTSVLSRTEKGHGMNKARKKYISVQGFPTVPSLFFRPTLAHFIGIFCIMPLSHHILAKHRP